MNRDYSKQRAEMVEKQLIARGITDQGVLAAMRIVPREQFVSGTSQFMAYNDFPLPIGKGQTISQPYIVALMTELLELEGTEKVLEIGTGSGYQTALLCQLARKVISIEKDKDFASRAQAQLLALGCQAKVLCADGTEGYIYGAPYDAILVTAAADKVPQPLLEQLKVGGRLVMPVGGRALQNIMLYTKKRVENDIKVVEKKYADCRFVPLKGRYGV